MQGCLDAATEPLWLHEENGTGSSTAGEGMLAVVLLWF